MLHSFTLILLYTNFILLVDSERDVGSLVVYESDNDKDIMSFITEFWGLDQYFDPFNTPKNVKMFQSKLLDALKIYIVSSISLNLVAPNQTRKKSFWWPLFDSTYSLPLDD